MADDPSATDDWAELLGAFAHELRTPLASANMVLQLSAMDAENGEGAHLDAELAGMLQQALAAMNELAERLQETSRLARGRLPLDTTPCSLPEIVDQAEANAADLVFIRDEVPGLEGAWDRARLVEALAAIVLAVNRAGDNSGRVRVDIDPGPTTVRLRFATGSSDAGPDPGDVSAAGALGFGFFHARELVRRMGGEVAYERRAHACAATVDLPLTRD